MKALVFILGLFFTISCGTPKNSLGEGVEWNSKILSEYSIDYPPNWTFKSSESRIPIFSITSSKTSVNDDVIENINLVEENISGKNLTLKTYSESVTLLIKSMLNPKGLTLTKGRYNGIEFYEAKYTISKNKTKMILIQRFYITNPDKALVLTFTVNKKDYSKYLFISKRMMDSFTI